MSEMEVIEPTEVLVPLDAREAERLDKRIRLIAQTTRENFEKVGRLLDEAKRGNVHEVLGFKSWTAYVADAVGGQLELSGDARQAMVALMSGEGMSVRAIAAATGVSKSTVDRDIAQVSHGGTPDSSTPTNSAVPQRDTSEIVDVLADGDPALAALLTDALADATVTVTGMDGKTYPKPARKPRVKKEPKAPAQPEEGKASSTPAGHGSPPKKKPAASSSALVSAEGERKVQIPTAYRTVAKELVAAADRLGVLAEDPRMAKAVERFTEKDRTDLDNVIADLIGFRAAMGEAPVEEKTA